MKMIGSLKYDSGESQEEIEVLAKMDAAIKKAVSGHLDFIDSEEAIEEISCQRVDGFIPSSGNKGGYSATGFVLNLSSAEEYISDPDAKAKINSIIEDGYKEAAAQVLAEKKEELEAKGITTVAELEEHFKDNSEYLDLYDEKLQEYTEDESVRFQIRIMFTGIDNGVYNFSVDSQANWEFPYFRDGKGCSAYKEEDIEVSSLEELEGALTGAINSVKSLFQG